MIDSAHLHTFLLSTKQFYLRLKVKVFGDKGKQKNRSRSFHFPYFE